MKGGKKMRNLIFVLVLAILALPALAQQGAFAEPAGAELERFPIKASPLTLVEQAELGLSAKRLEKPVVVQNHFRNIRNGRFVLETLPTGTLVLVDENGTLRYKADCGNRLVEPPNCLRCHNTKLGGDHITKPKASTPFREWLKRGWEGMEQLLGLTLGALLPLLGLLALLAVLGLLGYDALYRLFREWREGGGNNTPPVHPTTAPAQAPIPTQPMYPSPVPPAPEPMLTAPATVPTTPPATPTHTPTTPPRFPGGRTIIDMGDKGSATRIQAGSDVSRLELEEGPDGSTTIRIFKR